MNTAIPLLSARGLTAKRSWRTILENVSLDIFPGDRIYLTGPNGSGKTTFLETLLGLHPHSAGALRWLNRPGSPAAQQAFQRGEIFYLPQRDNLFASLTLRQNIFLGTEPNHRSERRLIEAMELLPDLKPSIDRKPAHVSAGQRQIAAVIRIVVREPILVVLDEPTAGIAIGLVAIVYDIVARLLPDSTAIVFTDQHAVAARANANHHFVLEAGQLRTVIIE